MSFSAAYSNASKERVCHWNIDEPGPGTALNDFSLQAALAKKVADGLEYNDLTVVEHLDFSVKLGHQTKPIYCLGIHPEENTTEPLLAEPLSPYYWSLPRPMNLPERCPLSAKKKTVQDSIWQLWSGNIKVAVFGGPLVYLDAMIDEDSGLTSRCSFGGKFTMKVTSTSGMEMLSANLSPQIHGIEQHFSSSLDKYLSEQSKEALTTRILHRFVRHYGHKLHWFALNSIFGALDHHYQSRSSYLPEKLDANMTRADLKFRKSEELQGESRTYEISKAIEPVGEVLEAIGRFEEAAYVYLELSKYRKDEDGLFYCNAALAFKRDQKYGKAFEYCIKSLHYHNVICNGKWKTNEYSPILNNLVSLHKAVHETQITDDTSEYQCPYPGEDLLLKALGTLICLSGFIETLKYDGPYEDLVPFVTNDADPKCLKRQFRSQKAARKQLARLFQTENAADYLQTLYSSFGDSTAYDPSEGLLKLNIQCLNKAYLNPEKKAAKLYLKEHMTLREFCQCAFCGIVDEVGSTFKACPCKAVYYCQKECQTRHWKMHKQGCSWQVQRRKPRKLIKPAKKQVFTNASCEIVD